MEKVKLYLHPSDSGKPYVRLFRPRRGEALKGTAFKKEPDDFRVDSFVLTEDPSEADFVVAPHGIRNLREKSRAYIDATLTLARQHKKKALFFCAGDLTFDVHIDDTDAILFKSSLYGKDRRENEVAAPGFVEDLAEVSPFQALEKGNKPSVGFCGYAGFPSTEIRLRYYTKNALLDLYSLINPHALLRKRGIYFRRKALAALNGNPQIETRFIIRNAYSGTAALSEDDRARVRREYIENIVQTHFTLSPKGDGNYSSRFYEALSLGRIPVLIDTDMALPFEKQIDYSKIIVRVPYTEIKNTAAHVLKFYQDHSDEALFLAQKEARAAFEKYLRYDAFFNYALPLLKEKGVSVF